MNRTVRGLLVLGGLLLLSCVALFIFVIKPSVDADEAMFGPLRAACSGQPVAGAASYPPDSGTPKLISFDRFASNSVGTSSHARNTPGWRATSLAETSLVLCLRDSEQKLIQECEYENNNQLNRYRFQQKVELREASTGELVAEETLRGPEPEECDEEVHFSRTDVIERRGDKVTEEQLNEWLRPYIEDAQG